MCACLQNSPDEALHLPCGAPLACSLEVELCFMPICQLIGDISAANHQPRCKLSCFAASFTCMCRAQDVPTMLLTTASISSRATEERHECAGAEDVLSMFDTNSSSPRGLKARRRPKVQLDTGQLQDGSPSVGRRPKSITARDAAWWVEAACTLVLSSQIGRYQQSLAGRDAAWPASHQTVGRKRCSDACQLYILQGCAGSTQVRQAAKAHRQGLQQISQRYCKAQV